MSLFLHRAGVLASGAGAWTPANLFASGELGAWYDPSDLSTLWQDTTGTTPVTADGQIVARMDDKSGNLNHILQATVASRPLYRTAGGLHWLEHDGVDDVLVTSGPAVAPTGNALSHFFAAVRSLTSPTVNKAVFSHRGGGSLSDRILAYASGTLLKADIFSQDLQISATPLNDQLYEAVFGNATIKAAVDGAGLTSKAVSTLTTAAANTIRTTGAVGVHNFRFYAGLIVEGELSGTDRSNAITYLGAKAGLTL